ncbi:Sec63 [Ceratobasidium sp. 428]|nr:Sec63 [Ceratobasidium sp. 428]
MRRVSQPTTTRTGDIVGHGTDYHGNFQDYYDPPQSWHASFVSPQHELLSDGAPISSPTPLPRFSNHSVAPRMLAVDEYYDDMHHTDTLEHEAFGNGEGSYSYDQLSKSGAHQSEYNTHAYTSAGNSTRSHPYVNQQKRSHHASVSLVPVSSLPDWCRGIFKFGVFNAMQSQCFATAMNTDSNMVISGMSSSYYFIEASKEPYGFFSSNWRRQNSATSRISRTNAFIWLLPKLFAPSDAEIGQTNSPILESNASS